MYSNGATLSTNSKFSYRVLIIVRRLCHGRISPFARNWLIQDGILENLTPPPSKNSQSCSVDDDVGALVPSVNKATTANYASISTKMTLRLDLNNDLGSSGRRGREAWEETILTSMNVDLNTPSGSNTDKSKLSRQEAIEIEGGQSGVSIDTMEVPLSFPYTRTQNPSRWGIKRDVGEL